MRTKIPRRRLALGGLQQRPRELSPASALQPGRARGERPRRCFAEGGTKSTTSSSKVTSPTRSRCRVREVARGRPRGSARSRACETPWRREPHRARDVEQHQEVRVGVGLELLHVVAVGARVEPPVDAPDVVAGHVRPVLGEVHRVPEVRRAVQAVDEALDDGPREQLEVVDPREHRGSRKRARSARRASVSHPRARARERPRAAGPRSGPWSTRSDSAWKLLRMRWRKHRMGERADVVEADVASGRCISARALPPSTRYWAARTLAPYSTHFLTNSGLPSALRPRARARGRPRSAPPRRPPARAARGAGRPRSRRRSAPA